MTDELQALDKRIQYWREKLHNLLCFNSPLDDKVIDCSRYLDKLLVEYERCKH
ncbi:Spo0E family sporulation regulatory protein-aspartic acid phosphatase [Clostridium bovifaecis]|uniref:Spo0E family sporulation regulatory protein-aspartic acid phosphatase n=1 Tax=Clostridium bovifaecis TaxID=2184719 RepID=A0A6I6F5M8_9CLOT|nr:Spo0E family sporulation regulatory protein-aspartic acid phosphatase [Clostridium bovifaecis]